MTLIQNANFGGLLAVMTSDTRQTLEGFGMSFRYRDAEKKIGLISSHCIFGGGGVNMVVDAIKEKLSVSGAVLVRDFEGVLQNIVDEMKQEGGYKRYFNDNHSAQIIVTGFNDDGTSGSVSYRTGEKEKVLYTQYERFEDSYTLISPSEDEVAVTNLVFTPPKELSNMAESTILYLAQVQAAYHENDEETVSEKLNYCAIYCDYEAQTFRYYEDQLDVSKINIVEQ